MFDPLRIKSDFPILNRKINGRRLVYLDNAATSQKPRQVINAITNYYTRHNANVARSIHTLAEESTQMYEQSRHTVANFLNAAPEEVIFVRNATEGLNLIAYSWGISQVKKDDLIITSVLEHHSSMLPWRMVAEKTGAKIKYIDVNDDGILDIGSLKRLLDSNAKVVALSAKSNMTGAIQPIKEALELVRKAARQAIFILDASHSVPHLPTDVTDLGVDFLAFSGHKMLGPMGIGVLWGQKRHLEMMPPFLRGGDMISHVTLTGQKWNTIPHKFEAGTPNVAGAVGLAAAIEYLEKLGMEAIHQHETELTKYALNSLNSLKSPVIKLIGPKDPDQRSGVVTFNVEGIHAHDVAQVLDRFGLAVRSGQHCTGPLMDRLGIPASVRVSFYLYNTKEDVDALVKALKEVPKVFKL